MVLKKIIGDFNWKLYLPQNETTYDSPLKNKQDDFGIFR